MYLLYVHCMAMSTPFLNIFKNYSPTKLVDLVGLEPTSNGLRVRYNKPLYDKSKIGAP